MTRRGTALQFLALATIVLTQTLGTCHCVAAEGFCPPLACAKEPAPMDSSDSGCCGNEADSTGTTACCLDLDIGWDLMPSTPGIHLPEPAVSRLADFTAIIRAASPISSSILFEAREDQTARPPGDPFRTLYCVRLN
jgi:hypothetical protein